MQEAGADLSTWTVHGLTGAESALVDGSDLCPQIAHDRHVVRLPRAQTPDDTIRDREVLFQHQGLVMGRGDGEMVEVGARGLWSLPVQPGAVLGHLGHLDISGHLSWKTEQSRVWREGRPPAAWL